MRFILLAASRRERDGEFKTGNINKLARYRVADGPSIRVIASILFWALAQAPQMRVSMDRHWKWRF
jgi:hypothetical protein